MNIQEIKESIALTFTPEPLKTLRVYGVVNGENELTSDGKDLFAKFLFHKEMTEFVSFIKKYENKHTK